MDYIVSILFVVTVIFLFSQLFLLKKKDEQANGLKWFVISAILLECFHAIVAGIFTMLSIKTGIVSTLIIDIVVAAALFLWNKKKGTQKYYITKYDIGIICLTVVVTLLISIIQFGIGLDICNFEINDPGNHIKYAGTFIMTGEVSSMYLATYNLSLCMETAIPFLDHYVSIYRIYILCEMWFFLLQGLTLYILTRNYIKKETTKKIVPFIIIAYMLAYPWNSMLMGSGYLNTGIILSGLMIILCHNVVNDKIDKKIALIFMGMGLYGIMVTYTLFATIVFGATYIAMLCYYRRNKTRIKTIILQTISLYIIPGLAGCYFMGLLKKPESAGTALSITGYIYSDLYINTIFFLPFLFIVMYKLYEKKQSSVLFWFVTITIGQILLMLAGGVNGMFSGYYFSKPYYVLSLLLHMILILYLEEALDKNKEFVFAYFAMYFFLMFIHISDAEWRIKEASGDMNQRIVTNQLFSLLDMNMDCCQTTKEYMPELRDLCDWVNNNISEDEQTVFIGEYVMSCWYEGLTTQRIYKFYERYIKEYRSNGDDNFEKNFESNWLLQSEDEYDYLVVIEESDAYYLNKKYVDTLEVIYRNELGFVAVVR